MIYHYNCLIMHIEYDYTFLQIHRQIFSTTLGKGIPPNILVNYVPIAGAKKK